MAGALENLLTDVKDAELVKAAADGDRQAYADLVRRHAARIYAVCLAMLRDPDDSQDVAQEALLKGMTRIGSLREGSQFGLWLTRIAQNLCRDHWRVQQRRRELLQENAAAAMPDGEIMPAGESSAPDLSAALARLPEKFRVPLMLYYFDGQSSENVARALDLSRAGAGTRLARARQALRQLLEKGHD